MLRMWALAAGWPDGRGGYVLALDPHAPETHLPLVAATNSGRSGLAGCSASGRRCAARAPDLPCIPGKAVSDPLIDAWYRNYPAVWNDLAPRGPPG